MHETKQQLVSEPVRKETPKASPLCADEWVQVRSRGEILATLDEHGRLDGMPFMPEMLAFCGKTLRVHKRAHKTCDTIGYSGARRLERTVHLFESRCDGSAHGGCEAACSLYWNEAWLKPAAPAGSHAVTRRFGRGCTVDDLTAAAIQGHDPEKGPRYSCQATEILNASKLIRRYDLRQYFEDYFSGNVGLATLLHGFIYRVGVVAVRRADRWGRRIGLGDVLARGMMAWYDLLQKLLPHGVPYPRRSGTIPKGEPTPDVDIGALGPGSRVRVKPYREILNTLNTENKTRGLYFDAEHVPYCDKEFSVRSLVNQIIDERTGYMMRFKTPAIILDNVVCQGTFSDHRQFCPRAIYPYWRTIWLRPIVEQERGNADVPAKENRVA